MKIGILNSWFTDSIEGSGTGVFFNNFAGGLHDRGYDIDLIAPNLRGEDYVNLTLQRFLFNTELRTDPRIQQADLLIGFDYDGYGIDPRQRPPMLASAHAVFGDVIQWEREPVRTMVESQAFFDKVSMQQADLVAVGSEYARGRLIELYGLPSDKVLAIPHGMTRPGWMKRFDKLERVPNDHPVILSVGKMYPRKRLDVLLRAMPALIVAHPDVELRIVGNGLEYERMRALSLELGVESNITWLGHIQDSTAFAREWRNADVFCHPSLQETFGYVYLEAMATGLPLVASCAGAAPEVIGDAGILVEPEQPDALAEALDWMITDSTLREAYAARGPERAAYYTQTRMIDAYVDVIETLAADRYRYYPVRNGVKLVPGW
jgi:glycosyltransferase involved in cell wall biosynthesis